MRSVRSGGESMEVLMLGLCRRTPLGAQRTTWLVPWSEIAWKHPRQGRRSLAVRMPRRVKVM